jgi:hypothetical protein
VVDPVDLVFGEARPDQVVDGSRGCEVLAQGLFEHDPRQRRDETGRIDLRADGREQAGRRGKEEHPHVAIASRELGLEREEVVGDGGVDAHVVQVLAERLPPSRIELVLEVGPARRLDLFEPGLPREVRPCDANQAGVGRHLARGMPPIQRRQELPHGEIPRSTEQDEVERRRNRHGPTPQLASNGQ